MKSCDNVTTEDIEDALLTANTRGAELVRKYVSTRIVERNIRVFSPMKRQNSKTFPSLYKSFVNTTGNVKKGVKADIRLMQRLLNAQQSRRNVNISSILKHKLSCIPISLANTDGTIKSNSKSALLGILSNGVEIATAVSSPYVSNARVGTCVLIDGHALIQNLGKPAGCQTVFRLCRHIFKSIFSHFSQGAARLDVVLDRYIGTQSIKSQTRVKRGSHAKKQIRKVASNGLVPLPQAWTQFVSLSEYNCDLAAFLAEDLVKRFPNVPAGCE